MNEVEIKARVRDLSEVMKKLENLGCVFSEPATQKDTGYRNMKLVTPEETKHENRLRIREQEKNGKKKITLTLKQSLTNDLDCIEKELEITDAQTMEAIIQMLGYTKFIQVHKTRRTAKYQQYEICLDEVEGLGSFMEVEKMTNEDSAQVQEELFQFASQFGIQREDLVFEGYHTIILAKQKAQV